MLVAFSAAHHVASYRRLTRAELSSMTVEHLLHQWCLLIKLSFLNQVKHSGTSLPTTSPEGV